MLGFWQRVKERMEALNVDKWIWLADKTDVLHQTLSQWILKDRLPNVEAGQKIAAALETSIEYLVTGEYHAGISPDSMEIFEKIEKMEKPDREEILAIIDLKLSRYTKYDSRTARTG